MGILRRIVSLIAAAAFAVSFVGAGFLACTLPPVTNVLSGFFSDDATSPFSRTQLTRVADATRDYSFGGHDLAALYETIYEIDLQYARDMTAGGGSLPVGFPDLDRVSEASDVRQLAAAFASASEMYCYSADAVAHLDDCYALVGMARSTLAIAAIVAVAGLIACGILGRSRTVGNALIAAGVVVLVVFAALAAFAIVEFDGFVTHFHQVFFSQGNWTFPYDSLLICALPTPFWAGMAAVWIAATLVLSLVSIVVGRNVRK